MMMFSVVPVNVFFGPQASMVDIIKTAWVIRLVFLGFELTFAIRVIVAYPWAAMATSNIQLQHLIKITHEPSLESLGLDVK